MCLGNSLYSTVLFVQLFSMSILKKQLNHQCHIAQAHKNWGSLRYVESNDAQKSFGLMRNNHDQSLQNPKTWFHDHLFTKRISYSIEGPQSTDKTRPRISEDLAVHPNLELQWKDVRLSDRSDRSIQL